MKFHKRINGGQYPIKFDVFLNYCNKDKELIYGKISKGISKSTYHILQDIIEATDLEEKAGWHFAYSGHYIIVISYFNADVPHYYGILQHELEHCIRASGRYLAFRQSEESEEYYCYLSGYLTEKIYERLWS